MHEEILDPVEAALAEAEAAPAAPTAKAVARCPYEAFEEIPLGGMFSWERREFHRLAAGVLFDLLADAHLLGEREEAWATYEQMLQIIDSVPKLEHEMQESDAALGEAVKRIATGEAETDDWFTAARHGVRVYEKDPDAKGAGRSDEQTPPSGGGSSIIENDWLFKH